MESRKRFAHGEQVDHFDHANCIGWTRSGVPEIPGSGCAVLLSNGDEGFKKMSLGKAQAGKTFIDFLGKHPGEIMLDQEGSAEFHVSPGTVSVWVAR